MHERCENSAVGVVERNQNKTVRDEVRDLTQDVRARHRRCHAIFAPEHFQQGSLRHVSSNFHAVPAPPVPVQMTSPATATREQANLAGARRRCKMLQAPCVVSAVLVLVIAGCSTDAAPAPAPAVTPTTTQPPAQHAAATCREPSGQQKAALRFAVRKHDADNDLRDAPWALVRKAGVAYMAAELEVDGPRLVVLVRFPTSGDYLAGMRAVNGTARSFTDLRPGGSRVPKGGRAALACVG